MKARLLLICLLILNTACGFHLRGSQQTNFDIANIYIQSSGASKLEKEVRSQLAGAGVAIAKSIQDASYIVNLKEERFEKSVLSVSAETGKVEEFQILYTARMDATDAQGKALILDDPIRISRDQVFDEEAVLGTFSEEQLIEQDLVRISASQVLRRLQALISKSN